MSSCPPSALDLPTIHLALAGDPGALARLCAVHQPLVLRIAHRVLVRLRLREPPAELAAEVWLRLLDHGCRALRPFDAARGSFHRFLKMVAWQHAFVVARRWARREEHELPRPPDDLSDPRAPCATAVLVLRMYLRETIAAVPRLTAVDLALLEEHLMGQTPVPELAPRLGCGVNQLHKRSQRLRARLRSTAARLEAEPVHAAA